MVIDPIRCVNTSWINRFVLFNKRIIMYFIFTALFADFDKQLSIWIYKPHNRLYFANAELDFRVMVIAKHLNKSGAANITRGPQTKTVLEGTSVLFFCRFRGSSLSESSLKFNGLTWKTKDFRNGKTIRLSKVQSHQNGYSVECSVKNRLQSDSKKAKLLVVQNMPPGFPIIRLEKTTYTGDLGRDFQLNCNVDGERPIKITWFHNSVPIDIKERHWSLTDTGSLIIHKMTLEDHGKYECQAVNRIGSSLSKEIGVKLINSQQSPKFTHNLGKIVKVRPGRGVNLTCSATGNPIPHLRWLTTYKQPINELTERESMLLLTDITENGTYLCQANNSLGRITYEIKIEVLQIPKPPINLKVTHINTNSALVSWRPNPHSPEIADSYTVMLSDTSNSDIDDRNMLTSDQITGIPAWSKSYPRNGTIIKNITRLKPYTKYSVRVFAVSNTKGNSDPSMPVYFQTKESAPTSAPQSIYAHAVGPKTITVRWAAPIDANGRITKYNVYYSRSNDNNLDTWQVSQTSRNYVDIPRLFANHTYHIKVNAENKAGPGPVSSAFPIFVRPGVPSRPQNFNGGGVTSTTINLIWTPPQIPADWIILDYLLTYKIVPEKMSAKGSKPMTKIIAADQTNYRIQELIPNTRYEIKLAARTKDGIGVYARQTMMTETGAPSSPIGISFRVLGPTSIEVKWRRGLDEFNHTGKFKIQFIEMKQKIDHSNTSDKSFLEAVTVNEDPAKPNKTYTLIYKKLIPGLRYKLIASYINNNCLSVPHNYGIFTTPKTPMMPSPPLNLHLNQLRRKTEPNGPTIYITDLAWDMPKDTHGKILRYEVKHRLVGPKKIIDSFKYRKIRIPVYYYNVTSTSFSTPYKNGFGDAEQHKFEVRAVNSNGDSGLPAYLNISTTESTPEGPPMDIVFTGVSTRSVNVTWKPPLPEHQNGKITLYKLMYYLFNKINSTRQYIETEKQVVMVSGLAKNSLYTFRILAATKVGNGPWSPEFNYRTTNIEPEPPVNITAIRINRHQIKVSWSSPLLPNNVKITGFKLYYCIESLMQDMEACPSKQLSYVFMTTINELKFSQRYRIALRSQGINNRFGPMSEIVTSSLLTSPSYPALTITLLVCEPKQRTVIVVWEVPKLTTGLLNFTISVNGFKYYRTNTGKRKFKRTHKQKKKIRYQSKYTEYRLVLKEVIPNTVYDISVKTIYNNTKVQGGIQQTSCRTMMERPNFVSIPKILSMNRKSKSVTIFLQRASEELGVIKKYYLIFKRIKGNRRPIIYDYPMEKLKSANPSMFSPIIVAEYDTEVYDKGGAFKLDVGGKNAQKNFQRGLLYRGIRLNMKDRYSALLRACVYDENQYQRTRPYQYKLKTPNLCRDSEWTRIFTFDKSFVPAPETTRRSTNSYGNKSNGKTSIIRPASAFTIWIIVVIVGLAITAIICITVGCYIKRRKVKRYYNSPQELIMNGDPTLKQALISQNNSAPPPYAPLSHSNGVIEVDGTLKSNYKTMANSGPSLPNPTGMPIVSTTALGGVIPNSNTPHTANPNMYPVIPSSHLADYIINLRLNDNAKFTEEYESIDPGHQFTWNHSNLEINKPKNRYANVIAYDHSRVILSNPTNTSGNDYINANYCDGYRKQNAFIATQGPLPETFESFWRMAWENRTSVIVMMTKLEERQRIKCDQYWPNRGSELYGNIKVSHLETVELAYYTVRKFNLTKCLTKNNNSRDPHHNSTSIPGTNESREILQFQFTAWPDHGVPESPLPLLMFVRRVRQNQGGGNLTDSGPIIVHCSAGVGRTGAFIVLDSQLSMLQHERALDIKGSVRRLRTQRNYMVQTEEQYVFVYEAMLEASLSGNTDISIRHLHAHVTKLKQPLPVLGITTAAPNQFSTGMELEFNHLSEVSNRPKQFTTANLPENRLKNRLINVLPFENCRVCLQPIKNQDGSDYINASYVDGYRSQRAYIATQGPLANTIADFWRMLWQHNSSIVVMLTHLREIGREKCCQYWPTDRAATFGQIVVEPMVEYNMPSFILREFRVRHLSASSGATNDHHHHGNMTESTGGSGHEENRTVRQFQFLDWPEQGVPRSGESLIDFIGQVHKTKDQFGHEGPITVHCSAGVGRTGVFLGLSIILDRMRSEGSVDLFQTIRLLRMQRPCMVQTEDQYQFCYLTALEYLSSFDQFIS